MTKISEVANPGSPASGLDFRTILAYIHSMHINPDTLLERPDFADRHRALRTFCLGMMVLLTGVAIFVALVVRFALGGKPLAGNGGLLSGIPILTVVTAVITLTAPLLGTILSTWLYSTGIARVALEPPQVPEAGADLDTDADRLWRVYASGKFAEYALAEGAVLATAILYHLTADPIMMLFVVGLLAYMASRYPTAARIRVWFANAIRVMAELRANRDAK